MKGFFEAVGLIVVVVFLLAIIGQAMKDAEKHRPGGLPGGTHSTSSHDEEEVIFHE